MAKVKANISFSGKITMAANEIRDIEDDYILNDLLNARYVKLIEEQQSDEEQQAQKKRPKKKQVISNED